VGEWRQSVASQDPEKFASLMTECRDFLDRRNDAGEVAER
jgi:hypothetical protein